MAGQHLNKKISPDTESNESKISKVLASQWVKRRMSLSDVPVTIRENLGVELEEITRWANRNLSIAILKLGDAMESASVVQILNGALEQCKTELPQ